MAGGVVRDGVDYADDVSYKWNVVVGGSSTHDDDDGSNHCWSLKNEHNFLLKGADVT